jgi:16S rRNA (guanine1207-N2)-methyltransferase
MSEKPSSNQYFTPRPESEPAERDLELLFGERRFVLRTDAGVFSPRFVDRGTSVLLSALPLPMEGDLLDWGAGYGPIGIAVAAFSPEARVVMVEINERAAGLAEHNRRANAAVNAEVVVGDAFEVLGDRRFDAIIANPPIHAGKTVVTALIRDAHERLRPGGQLWLVIQTRAGAKTYHALLQKLFARAERVAMRGGYRVLRATV